MEPAGGPAVSVVVRHSAGKTLVTVSGLVLNFVPNQPDALSKMRRVTVSGGTIGAYVSDYAGRMDLMRFFWDAAVALNPDARAMDEGVRFSMCQPATLAQLFGNAGLREVEVTALNIPTLFTDFEDYWRPFFGRPGTRAGVRHGAR